MNRTTTLAALALAAGLALTGCTSATEPSSSTTIDAQTEGTPAPEASAEAPTVEPAPVETTEAAPAPTEAAEATVGTPFTVDMGQGNTALITVVSATRTPDLPSSFPQPSATGEYLVMDVLWETQEGVTSANPFYFAAKNADGFNLDSAFGVDQALTSGDVAVGDKLRGFLAYESTPGQPITVTITDPGLQEAARFTVN